MFSFLYTTVNCQFFASFTTGACLISSTCGLIRLTVCILILSDLEPTAQCCCRLSKICCKSACHNTILQISIEPVSFAKSTCPKATIAVFFIKNDVLGIYKAPNVILTPSIPINNPIPADPRANLTSLFCPRVASLFCLMAPRNMRAGKM